jgi:hypothetical protein
VLLPSQQLVDLSKRFAICLSGKKSPANCDIRYRQMYWLMVFDDKGELRSACRLGDQLTKVTKQGFDVPNAFVEVVEQAIASPTSLEQCERDYLASNGSAKAFAALQAKVKELQGVGQMRVAGFLATASGQAKDPVRSRARGLQVEADACSHQVINYEAFAKLRDGVVEFVAAHPEHPAAAELLQPLLEVGMKYSFDLEAKCRAYAQTWSRGDQVARKKLAARLLKQAAKMVAAAKQGLLERKPGAYGYLRLQAVCGDASAVLAGLETSKTFGVMRPIHAEWRTEAKAKLASTPDK